MFQFTTTNLINSSKDIATGKELWTASEANESTGTPASLHVKRVHNFLKPNVTAIYKAVANDPEMARVQIDFASIKVNSKLQKGDILRLSIFVGLTQASQDSRYSNDYYYKGKPITIEFEWKGLGDITSELKALCKTIEKHQLLIYTERLFNIDYNAQGILIIEGTTEFQRFRKVNVERFNSDTPPLYLGEYKPIWTLEDVEEVKESDALTEGIEGYFVGKEGFGTYSYLLHNIRIPTSYRTRVFSIDDEEIPIPGAKYNQYTIHYCADRGILGLNAVGEITKSVTTHVFFVREDLSEDFEDALKKIAPEEGIVEVPKKD